MEESLKIQPFGRYLLLDLIAQGGAADIFRARYASPDAPSHLLAIKKLKKSFESDAAFRQMMKTETQLALQMNHPNVAHIYDFGEVKGQTYLAMEYIEGRNLRQLTNRLKQLKQKFSPELAAYIIEQAATGLHYAHELRDPVTEEPLRIIHRDISPQNILISFEGQIKLIDFGVAKSDAQQDITDSHVIKGKIRYLSPEQVYKQGLDQRSDLFALGIVLWELLTGKRLFDAQDDLAILKQIDECERHIGRPSVLEPQVPPELDSIVLKCLARSKEERYASAQELQNDLHEFLERVHPEFNPSSLKHWMMSLFKVEMIKDRDQVQSLNASVDQHFSKSSPQNEFAAQEDTTGIILQKIKENATGARDWSGGPVSPREPLPTLQPSEPVQLDRPRSIPIVEEQLRRRSQARKFNKKYVQNPFQFLKSASLVVLIGACIGFWIRSDLWLGVGGTGDAGAERSLFSARTSPLRPLLERLPEKDFMRILGKKDPNESQDPVLMDVERKLAAVRERQVPLVTSMRVPRTGLLTIRTVPSAEVTLRSGRMIWKRQAPFENEPFPSGKYVISLENRILRLSKTIQLTLNEGKVLEKEVVLSPMKSSKRKRRR